MTFTLSDGVTISLNSTGSAYATPDFFGVIDTTGITSVQVTSPDFVLNVNGVTTVPEPSTWATMLLGFAGLGFAGYRASRRSAAAA